MEKIIIDNSNNELLEKSKKIIKILKSREAKALILCDENENIKMIFSLNNKEELEIFIEDNK